MTDNLPPRFSDDEVNEAMTSLGFIHGSHAGIIQSAILGLRADLKRAEAKIKEYETRLKESLQRELDTLDRSEKIKVALRRSSGGIE